MEHLLLLLVVLPILSGTLFLFFRSRIAKYSALAISLLEMTLAIAAFFMFRHDTSLPYTTVIPWIREWGINVELGIDGINILFVLLTGIAIPVIILAGWEKNYHNYGLMDGMMLILQGALMGVYLSFNAFLYYIFWEMTLIPAYIILLLWGGEHSMRITLKFFIYTLAGSLFMLIALISIYLATPGDHSFSHQAFLGVLIEAHHQNWIFLALLAAFLIKTPIFPFHSWQPETYTEAPSAGTMLLSGLMSKMGIFSILRWLLPVLPLAATQFAPWIMWLAVFSLIYASVIALRQKNIKTLFAYSSIAHLSLVVAAVFTLGSLAIQGALLMVFSHGIAIISLFFIADIIKVRTDSQWLPHLGGFRSKAPAFAALYLVILLASVGFPLTSGFPGEFLMITGLAKTGLWQALAAGLGLILSLVYMLVAYKTAMLGETSDTPFADLNAREKFVFTIMIVLILMIGIFPTIFLKTTESGVSMLVNLFLMN
jgi:NADH-quinone oxidoreductase subunit M